VFFSLLKTIALTKWHCINQVVRLQTHIYSHTISTADGEINVELSAETVMIVDYLKHKQTTPDRSRMTLTHIEADTHVLGRGTLMYRSSASLLFMQ
jgi:hypothetical protein